MRLFATTSITASAGSRTITGTVVRFNEPGRTTHGLLRVRPGALRWPDDLGRIKLTREHDRDQPRGHMTAIEQTTDGIRASFRVSDGPAGDAALSEASDRTRDGLSFDVIDAVVDGDEITEGLIIAVGQVGIPAYESGQIEHIAASTTEGNHVMTPAQRARLAELRALTALTPEQTTELETLTTLEAAGQAPPATADQPAVSTNQAPPATADQPAVSTNQAPPATADQPAASTNQVAAAMATVPAGVPRPATQVSGPAALATFYESIAAALQPGAAANRIGAISAALADITHSAHTSTIEAPAWSGELWSGLLYQPEFTPLLNSAGLTNWSGQGWRFTKKLEIQDYAGDKTEIPTDTITTEPAEYQAARMAVGVDIDRKFFDFPNSGFIQSLFEQVRESWAIQLDAKVRAWIVANAVAATTGTPQPSLLKAAARAALTLKRRRVGKASFIVVNDDDYFTLLDYTEKDVPAFLELWGIKPENFVASNAVQAGTVLAGVRQVATVRTLPGSPIRVEAQHLANGGVDEAFFGYWAVEQHHKAGIAAVGYEKPVAA